MQDLESRLFSEGLHVLGEAPSSGRMHQFLEAYFDGAMPSEAVEAVSGGSDDLDAIKQRLEASLNLVCPLSLSLTVMQPLRAHSVVMGMLGVR